jgi:addiction module HigA family antidote
MEMFNPPHPGEVLKDLLPAIPMSVTKFAAHIGVSRVALSRVLNGHAGVSAEMSIKLGEAFNQSQPNLWFKMQNSYDFWQAAHKKKRKKVRAIKLPPFADAA